MRKNRKLRKTLARRSYWNFKTKATTMADAYKVSAEDVFIDEDEDPRSLPIITCNSIKDIEALRDDCNALEPDHAYPVRFNPFE